MSHKKECQTEPCVIGIVGNFVRDGKGVIRYSVSQEYVNCVEKAGADVLIIPAQKQIPERIFSLCDGFLFPGGGDIDPALFGRERRPEVLEPLEELDTFQIAFMREILRRRIPFLATCRGCQVLNVAMGGTLIQHVEGHEQTCDRSETFHRVRMEEGTKLCKMLGNECMINSFHHQVIEEVADGLVVSARADDGLIEAVEVCDYPYGIAVQWHPEVTYAASEDMKPLFQTFVEACESGR